MVNRDQPVGWLTRGGVGHLLHEDVSLVAVQIEDTEVENCDLVDLVGGKHAGRVAFDRPNTGNKGLERADFWSCGAVL